MRKVISCLALSAFVLTASVPLLAHHGAAAFDSGKNLVLKGTVTEWLWSNPHCLLRFDVKGDDGQTVHWIGETQNPVTMLNGGWAKASFKPGDAVTITMNPVKNGLPLGRIVTAKLPDGTVLDASAGIRGNVYK